jgi:hypothetical protein
MYKFLLKINKMETIFIQFYSIFNRRIKIFIKVKYRFYFYSVFKIVNKNDYINLLSRD